MKELTYKSKLYATISAAYKNDWNVENFLKFRVIYELNSVKSFGATYTPRTKTIRILLNGNNFEDLLLSVLIHEASHHIQCVKEGKTNHSENFRKIQKKLLFKAIDLKYINPFKLRAYYKYLSSYAESNKVIAMINEYVSIFKIQQDVYFIGYIISYNVEEIKKLKREGFKFCKAGNGTLANIWYKFSEYRSEPIYTSEQCEILVD